MNSLRSRPILLGVLVAVLVVLTWLVVQAARGGPASDASPTPVGVTITTTTPGSSDTPGGATDPVSGLPWIAASALPPEARATLALIRAGGPYPYPRSDNQTFANRERLLPAEPRGYYKEFTVITPGSGDRGARRIITGSQGERYWTADHYASFSRIEEGA
ncbi:ribonuclease domain-containing protein [Humibacillus xanthopallidus]|uniref:Ribonuclease T1 n=1 Tax=Humibacillus xanthopallidus TaxID=412689 RepID=A0A543HWH2_9MICO|nr:ribonuclease domain-containing protein [Humibacillus xanthopallidus]TQM62640.1 ribonuclease T1 [Humibacillus xanthopallidus]